MTKTNDIKTQQKHPFVQSTYSSNKASRLKQGLFQLFINMPSFPLKLVNGQLVHITKDLMYPTEANA